MKKYVVNLSEKKRAFLRNILQKGKHSATVRKRVQVLQMSDKGLKDEDISLLLEITVRAICNIRRHYCQKGIEKAVYGESRSGRPPKYDITDETELVALACSDPPEGRSKWTLDLLKENVNGLMGRSTIHLMLKKTDVNLGSKKCGVSEESTPNTENGCTT